MDLISLLVVVVVLAIVFYLIATYVIPLLPPPWGRIALAIIALIVILWLLSAVGLLPGNLRLR